MLALLSLIVAIAVVPAAEARRCYDSYYRRYYYCSGLSYGARIGIGVGVAAGVIVLCLLVGACRRKQIQSQFKKYRPPVLPQTNQTGGNPYANNPPPPQAGTYQTNTNWNQNAYGNNVSEPASAYQPSMAGQYKAPESNNEASHEHGYEWEQAREQERLERLQANNTTGVEPPSYDTASTQNTGNTQHYAPPPGPPPTKTN